MTTEKQTQIDKLANFIMNSVDGEPSQNEGAGDTAIRIIKQQQALIEQLVEALQQIDERLENLGYDRDGTVRNLAIIALAAAATKEKEVNARTE